MTESRNKTIGSVLLGIILAGVLCWNFWFWSRAIQAEKLSKSLEDATCKLLSDEYDSGWKMGWTIPFVGPSWTDVPCRVGLKIFPSSGSEIEERTELHFTYYQGAIWEYVKDRCRELVPSQLKAGRFDCAYAPGPDGAATVFVGKASSLPKLPMLLFMKAAGLSLCTLGPLVLILGSTLRGYLRGASAREVSLLSVEAENAADPADASSGYARLA
eukprot:TRINITY_DN48927_c0_g1_i1.p1 TRINITY_DN48927_c0_g1~~TRINITY_DN48927_c0_g1_i1.p1  ORF type:complete len:231 (-),score=37.25 TRINITY_DN48927_c0_g1_i1:148-792(-)